jgi:hypothetical protein
MNAVVPILQIFNSPDVALSDYRKRFSVMCVLCLIVVPLSRGKTQFAVQLNNNNNKIIC